MDQSTQAQFRAIIGQRLDVIATGLAAAADEAAPISPDAAIGRLSRLDSMQVQQMALAGRRRLGEERTRLQEAQCRIEAGTYGRCLVCGRDIAVERLEYQPEALACVSCRRNRK